MAEKPARVLGRGDGIAAAKEAVRQTSTARPGRAGEQPSNLMEEVLRRENVLRAYKRVVRNGGAAGVDGMTVDDLAPYCRDNWPRVREELLSGTYRPQPVRKVEIPKPGGGRRMLGIPTVLDRLIQQSVLQVLQPLLDPDFSDSSYGFRPGRSAHQAVSRAREHLAAGYDWVVDLDLEKFFDRVNHDILMSRLARRIADKKVLLLIRRYLEAGMLVDGVVSARTEGTPQGGPLSPLLSNVLLDDLDKELERRGHRFSRYADDCNVYVQSEAAGTRVMSSLERFLSQHLRLTVNRSKSAVGRPWERKFLGYSFTSHRKPKPRVAEQSVKRLKSRLQASLRRARGSNLDVVMSELAPVLRGWVAYFRLSEVKTSFYQLDEWIRRKLRAAIWRQWKTPRTRRKELVRRGLEPAVAAKVAGSGFGPWRSARARAMYVALPTAWFRDHGLVSLVDEVRRLQCSN